jgi:hypothetical protein
MAITTLGGQTKIANYGQPHGPGEKGDGSNFLGVQCEATEPKAATLGFQLPT